MIADRRPEQATSTCSFCPKACRFACPVSEATHSEALSAWGKMSAAHQVLTGARPMGADLASAVHACTGCGRCTAMCKHENEVGLTLFQVRGHAVQAGVQPRGAASTLATFQQAQNPFGREMGSLVASWRAQRPVKYPLFPGCSTLVKRPSLLEHTLALSEAFGAPMGVARSASKCCGYPLYAAGAMEAFGAHARAVAEAFEETPEVAVLDAGCAFTLVKLYPEVGVRLPCRVRTVIDVLHENLPHAPPAPPLAERVGYHDACHLGRGLGQYDEPRALLSKAVTAVVEAPSIRREGGCAGGGGLLPRTMAETAVEVARRQALEVAEEPSVLIVSGCPTSTRMFERAGRRAIDLVSLLERWVSQS
ncbi:MAG: (Fe-S)-binding protein [Myxococcaceae bacterium]|nr:(Fe-S)-binding protein [Myxococcaceae bacterium]